MEQRSTCDCPSCGGILQRKALTDSDQRVHASWLYCEACGWDERTTTAKLSERQTNG